ncbi:MAG: beta-class carbonic anhydrase [Thermoleophilaceae bacterium]
MSATDRLLEANRAHAAGFGGGGLDARPATGVAVVTCMDARVDVYALLGLEPGDAHVIRNAGGVVTDEVIRSLTISQHKLGTTEVAVIGHTGCGLEGLDQDEFADELERETRAPRDWSIAAFADVGESVRESIARLRESPFLSRSEGIRGFVYDIETGALREVS